MSYGYELVLDLHDCDVDKFTRKSVNLFCVHICAVIDMELGDFHTWESDPEDYDTDPAHIHGVSAVQWGGIEALVSRHVSAALGVPVAHAPIETNPNFNEIVPPAIAPELISNSNLFSVLKGLHRAPRIGTEPGPRTLTVDDVDAMVSPDCWGAPHEACVSADVPIITVRSNTTNAPVAKRGTIEVASYMEAAGALVAIREGIAPSSLNREPGRV